MVQFAIRFTKHNMALMWDLPLFLIYRHNDVFFVTKDEKLTGKMNDITQFNDMIIVNYKTKNKPTFRI